MEIVEEVAQSIIDRYTLEEIFTLSKEERLNMNALDEAAERAGGYFAMLKRPLIIEYDYRAMTEY